MTTVKKTTPAPSKFPVPSKASAVKTAAVAPAAKKPSQPKGKSKGRAALYRLLNDAKKTWEAFTGQKAIVVKALVAAKAVGKTGTGITSKELYAALAKTLKTDSTVERIAGFYLSTWQKDGIIEKYEPAA